MPFAVLPCTGAAHPALDHGISATSPSCWCHLCFLIHRGVSEEEEARESSRLLQVPLGLFLLDWHSPGCRNRPTVEQELPGTAQHRAPCLWWRGAHPGATLLAFYLSLKQVTFIQCCLVPPGCVGTAPHPPCSAQCTCGAGGGSSSCMGLKRQSLGPAPGATTHGHRGCDLAPCHPLPVLAPSSRFGKGLLHPGCVLSSTQARLFNQVLAMGSTGLESSSVGEGPGACHEPPPWPGASTASGA